jgi:thiamine biosynthesis lipoprotein
MMRAMSRRPVLLSVILVVGLLAIVGHRMSRGRDEARYVSFTAHIMAAPISVTAPEEVAEEAARVVFEVFREVDTTMSEWKPTSPLSAVNRAAGGDAVAVPDDLRALIRRCGEVAQRTDGAFDVTWAALWGLWDFNAIEPRVPDDEEIAARVALVDHRRVVIDDEAGTVHLPQQGMAIGLGGIAKGHALDVAAQALRDHGIDSFMISAAGQMMLGGRRGDRLWRVGVRDPRGGPRDYVVFLELTDVSVSTSGDYERYFVLDGVRHHHILDPRTGRSSRGVRSATVVSADATLADALSTSLMILGIERGLAVAEAWEGVEALMIDGGGSVHVTSGLRDRVQTPRDPGS